MMNQNNENLNNNQKSVTGMSFVTGENPLPEQNTVNQSVVQHSNVVNSNLMVDNTACQPVTQQPNVVNTNRLVDNTSLQQAASPTVVSQPVINTVQDTISVNSPNTLLSENSNAANQTNVAQTVNNTHPVQGVNEHNNLSSVQSNVIPNNNSNNNDELKSKKKINPIIIVLLVIVLTAVGVFLGIFLFNKFGNKGNNEFQNENISENESSNNLSNNIINNTNVDFSKLNEVLNALGISSNHTLANNDSLNYYLSFANFRDNASDIIVYASINNYGKTSSEIILPDEYDLKSDVGACSDSVGCALITKTDAENVMKLYNLGDDLSKYFYKSSEIEDVYGIHYSGTLVIPQFNGENAGINHVLNAELSNDNDIKISDNQTITYYDDLGAVQTKNSNVIYLFKLSNAGSYYLDNVSVIN